MKIQDNILDEILFYAEQTNVADSIRKEKISVVLQSLLKQAELWARVDEISRMPSPGYIGNDGIRREPNERYKIDRVAKLESQMEKET